MDEILINEALSSLRGLDQQRIYGSSVWKSPILELARPGRVSP